MLNNPDALEKRERYPLAIEAESVELALLQTLEEMIFYKDARGLFLSVEDVQVQPRGDRWAVAGNMTGEAIDPQRHDLAHDVKAVTMHRLNVRQTNSGWEASVILDV